MASPKFDIFKLFGHYPAEYNRAVHGTYLPYRDYRPNKPGPLKDVKLGDLRNYLKTCDTTPKGAVAMLSRNCWYWFANYADAKRGRPSVAVFQLLAAMSFVSWIGMWSYLKTERRHKYHW